MFPDDCVTILTFLLECGMNVHHKCQKKVANLCGINQKLLAEALNQVSQVSFIAVSQVIACFHFGVFTSSFLHHFYGELYLEKRKCIQFCLFSFDTYRD